MQNHISVREVVHRLHCKYYNTPYLYSIVDKENENPIDWKDSRLSSDPRVSTWSYVAARINPILENIDVEKFTERTSTC